MAQIPPWLDINPGQVAQGYEAGARLGMGVGQAQLGATLDRERMAQANQMEQARLSQNTMMKQAELNRQMQMMAIETQQKQAQLAQQAQTVAMEMARRREELQRDTMIQQQKLNIEKSYNENLFTLGQEKNANIAEQLQQKMSQPAKDMSPKPYRVQMPDGTWRTGLVGDKGAYTTDQPIKDPNVPIRQTEIKRLRDFNLKLEFSQYKVEQDLARAKSYPDGTQLDNSGTTKEQVVSGLEAQLATIKAQRQQKQKEIDALQVEPSTSSTGTTGQSTNAPIVLNGYTVQVVP